MNSIAQKLAQSLEILHNIQKNGKTAIKSSDLTRTHKERLIKNGFLKEVIRGWYISARPGSIPGQSTDWYSSYWSFISEYMNDSKGNDWVLSPEASLLIHTENSIIPKQLLIRSIRPSNKRIEFIHNTSILNFSGKIPEIVDIKNNLRIFTLTDSLVYITEKFYQQNLDDAKIALSMIKDSSEILRLLLKGDHSVISGRLAGAFRNIGRDSIANDIINTMKNVGYKIYESDPFLTKNNMAFNLREPSPYVIRIKTMWSEMREIILNDFPKPSQRKKDKQQYLKSIDDVFVTDAYNSLSIEGYKVTKKLIEKIKNGEWNPEQIEEDKKTKDALAAKGYYLTFQEVKKTIIKIIDGKNSNDFIESDLKDWYQHLFQPSVSAGILDPMDLAGYRNDQVYLSNSMHVPPNKEAVRDLMPVFFELLCNEKEASVRAISGHFIFSHIHPYMDGNGRISRFLMNTMFASGGYDWLVIPLEQRTEYMLSLEQASVEKNIQPFSNFITQLMIKTE